MIIRVAKMRARNISTNHFCYIELDVSEKGIFFMSRDNGPTQRYISIHHAWQDIADLYGKWHDFEIIYTPE